MTNGKCQQRIMTLTINSQVMKEPPLSDFIADLQAQHQSFQASSTGLDDNDEFKKFIMGILCVV